MFGAKMSTSKPRNAVRKESKGKEWNEPRKVVRICIDEDLNIVPCTNREQVFKHLDTIPLEKLIEME